MCEKKSSTFYIFVKLEVLKMCANPSFELVNFIFMDPILKCTFKEFFDTFQCNFIIMTELLCHGTLGVESTSTFWGGFFESLKLTKQDLSIIEFNNQV